MANEEDEAIVDAADEQEDELTPDSDLTEDATDWKAEAIKARRIAARRQNKITKLSEAKVVKPTEEKPQSSSTKDGLDETQLDYLDLKGFNEPEDIKVIEDIVKKTGMTVRQALKDDYVVNKLASLKSSREVLDATPSSKKRSSGDSGNDLHSAIAKYEQSGMDPNTLPEDFKTRIAVINAIMAKQGTNKPSWQK